MWAQASTGADVTGVSAGLAPTMMGLPAVITVAELARPPVPAVLNVNDRAVYVDNINEPPPGYVLARRWMRNDPDTDVESLALQGNQLVLPRPLPATAASAEEAPVFPDDSEDYDPEEAVKALKRHWVNVRRHDTEQRWKNLERYKDRMKAVTSTGVNAAAVQQMLAQQQQQQLQQQMQQQQTMQALQPPGAAAALGQGLPAMPPQQQQQQQQQQALQFAAVPGVMQPVASDLQQQQQQLPVQMQGMAAPMHEQQQAAAAVDTAPVVDTSALGGADVLVTQPELQQQQVLEQQSQRDPAAAGDAQQMDAEGAGAV